MVTCAPGALIAQEFRGVGTLGYGHSSVSNGGGDISSFTLDGAGSVNFDSGVHIGFDATIAKIDPDQAGGDVDANEFGLTLNYQFTNGTVLGGYIDHASIDTNPLGSGDFTSYGLSGGYVNNEFGVELFFGETETSPSLPAGVDWVDYGINVRYAATDQFRFGGHYIVSELSGGGSVDLSSWGIGGTYSFANGWSGFAGVSQFDIETVNADATTFGFGAGYNLQQVVKTPALLSLELARTDLSVGGASADVDTIRLGITFALGDSNGEQPLNSVARSVMSPRHNSVSTAINTAF